MGRRRPRRAGRDAPRGRGTFPVRVGERPYPVVGPPADDGSVTTDDGPGAPRRRRGAAGVLLALGVTGAVTAVAAGSASGAGWARLADLLVVSNTVIGLALVLAGWPIAALRPGNPVGWSLLAGGCLYAGTGAGVAVLAWAGEPTWPWRVLATAANGAWTWSLALLVPLALTLFPDGRLPGPRWRWLVAVLVAAGVLLTAAGVLAPDGGLTAGAGVPGYPARAWPVAWLDAAYPVGLVAGYGGAVAALVVRYRRGGDPVRRQVLWLLLAVLLMLAAFTVDTVLGADTLLLGILPVLLLPAAITVAVLRYRLIDIRLAVSRSLLYLLLSGGVVVGYLALVALLDAVVRRPGAPVFAALAVALAFNPARVRLQRRVHRALYGARRDPVRAMAAVGARLGAAGTTGAGLDGVLEALCRVLRFPAAALVVDGRPVAAHGELPAARHTVALPGDDRGELLVGLRSGEHRLAAEDETVLALLAAPVAVAVRAGRLAGELSASRERVITGREEERRRIRRDLHDGLGPVLTGVMLNADTALHLLDRDRDRSAALLADVRDQTIGAIDEIRRLVYDLRPPALDGMGLAGAVREYAALLSRRSDEAAITVAVEAPPTLGELPAAVEVAAYRIATEALTNVVRHSGATSAVVRLAVADAALRVDVRDNGANTAGGWRPGVGLTSIRERAAELGGACELHHAPTGGRVSVVLPFPRPDHASPSTGGHR